MKILIVLALLLSSCQSTHLDFQKPQGFEFRSKKTAHFFLFGLIPPEKVYSTRTLCGKGAVMTTAETYTSFLNGLLTGLTFAIYTPQNIIAKCVDEDEYQEEDESQEED